MLYPYSLLWEETLVHSMQCFKIFALSNSQNLSKRGYWQSGSIEIFLLYRQNQWNSACSENLCRFPTRIELQGCWQDSWDSFYVLKPLEKALKVHWFQSAAGCARLVLPVTQNSMIRPLMTHTMYVSMFKVTETWLNKGFIIALKHDFIKPFLIN
jgi:hypothetical protein